MQCVMEGSEVMCLCGGKRSEGKTVVCHHLTQKCIAEIELDQNELMDNMLVLNLIKMYTQCMLL